MRLSPRFAHGVLGFLIGASTLLAALQIFSVLWLGDQLSTFPPFNDLVNDSFVRLESEVFTFPCPSDFQSLHFRIEANGGTANDSLARYCSAGLCSIPLVFGGNQTIDLFNGNKLQSSFSVNTTHSRFHCVNGGWERRICRFREICFDNNNLTFIAPYPLQSTVPFLVLGGRSPPYDRKRDRIYFLNVNVSQSFTLPPGRVIHNETTYYASPYYNMHMMWHLLFDFALPLFHTVTLFTPGIAPAVIIPHDADFPRSEVLKSFTSSYGRMKNTHCYRDLIVGISKVKDALTGKVYEFPKNFTHHLHPLILKQFKLNGKMPTTPIILVIGRKTGTRVLTNIDDLVSLLQTDFPNFKTKPIYFEDLPMKDQIHAAHTATVMIGVHGSGLAHVAWMRPGTVLVEIFPYKFDCRDWYEKATVVSGVKYFKYVPSSPDESPGASPIAQNCWREMNGCDGNCVDTLRDQNVLVNLTLFRRTMKDVLS
jgi:hypothetical protein